MTITTIVLFAYEIIPSYVTGIIFGVHSALTAVSGVTLIVLEEVEYRRRGHMTYNEYEEYLRVIKNFHKVQTFAEEARETQGMDVEVKDTSTSELLDELKASFNGNIKVKVRKTGSEGEILKNDETKS